MKPWLRCKVAPKKWSRMALRYYNIICPYRGAGQCDTIFIVAQNTSLLCMLTLEVVITVSDSP